MLLTNYQPTVGRIWEKKATKQMRMLIPEMLWKSFFTNLYFIKLMNP